MTCKTTSTRALIGLLCFVLVPLTITAAEPVEAPSAEGCPISNGPNYDPVVFSTPGAGPCFWRRPENVRFITLQGCGGGGSGTGDGRGGSAGEMKTIILGPLTQDRYKIQLANFAPEKVNGGATTFEAQDLKITFQGGIAGAGSGLVNAYSPATSNRIATDGSVTFYGGDAGIGAGGRTGRADNPPEHGQDGGHCAGGGGGIPGFQPNYTPKAGKGGPGWLAIIPHIQYAEK